MSYEHVLLLLALLSHIGVTSDTLTTSAPTVEEVRVALESITRSTSTSTSLRATSKETPVVAQKNTGDVFTVPYYSQFADISSAKWQKVGCGIASLAMLVDFYTKDSVDVDTLLQKGISAGAYLSNAGWTYSGLIGVAHAYGLTGASHDLAGSTVDTAFAEFTNALKKGPVMASVHYTFKATNPIPHLVIVTGVTGDKLYYNDPAMGKAGDSISVAQFKSSWKKRYIEFWPVS